MRSLRTVQNFQLLVWVVTLFVACYVITVVETSEHNLTGGYNETTAQIESNNVRKCRDDDNLTEEQTNELREFILVIFRVAFSIASFIFTSIFSIIYQILRPVIYIAKQFYYTFFTVPFGLMKSAFLTVYPVITFLAVAALLGLCFGGTAGWISEVIVGVLTTPINDDEPIPTEIENKRHIAKVRKRAAALANLKAKNGGKLPEEYYSRIMANGRPNMMKKGSYNIESYETGGYENDYKSYSGAGIGD